MPSVGVFNLHPLDRRAPSLVFVMAPIRRAGPGSRRIRCHENNNTASGDRGTCGRRIGHAGPGRRFIPGLGGLAGAGSSGSPTATGLRTAGAGGLAIACGLPSAGGLPTPGCRPAPVRALQPAGLAKPRSRLEAPWPRPQALRLQPTARPPLKSSVVRGPGQPGIPAGCV